MAVEYSRMLTVMSSSDLDLRCFRVLRRMAVSYATQHQNLSSGKHTPHPARHASPRTVQSQSVWIALLIGISHRKAVGDFFHAGEEVYLCPHGLGKVKIFF